MSDIFLFLFSSVTFTCSELWTLKPQHVATLRKEISSECERVHKIHCGLMPHIAWPRHGGTWSSGHEWLAAESPLGCCCSGPSDSGPVTEREATEYVKSHFKKTGFAYIIQAKTEQNKNTKLQE